MNDNIKDPREIGVKGLRGIRMGEVDSPSLSPEYTGLAPMKKMSGREYLQRQIEADIDRGPIEYVGTDEYGNSRYDDEITQLSEIKDINEARANIQPWYDQIGAGVLKGTVLAATTFADGIGGTIVGAMNVLGNIDKIQNSDSPLRELGNQFINNPFSTTMQEINEKMESTLPNYYTQEEMNAPWWENVFTSNFIGDKFLKNLGFTVGAAYSGRLSAGLLSKTMGLKGVRDAFKGTVTTASGKVLNTADEISKAYKTGDAFMDGVKLTEDLGNAAKKLKNAEWKLKTMGAISGAMGEGRIEAISNSKEFYDYHAKLIEDDRKKKTDFLEYQLYQEHPEWFDYVETDGRFSRVLTSPEGIAEWENRKEAIDTKYQNALGKLAKDRASMANAVFIANVGLLSASNMWQYGRFLTGGYNSGRLANGLVKGSAKEGFKYNSEYAKRQLAKAASNPLVEAQEEMSQAMIAETTGQKYASELNEFYGARISPDAEKQTIDWLKAIETGFMNTYGDVDKWEEGFLGGLTGLLGIPSISMKKTDKGRRPSLTLEGELWEGLRDYKKDKTEATELVSALNNRLQSPEFLNYYQGMIRHNKYQNDMESALNKGDKFSYKNAELSQFVSDAIMFEKAGRLQDLYDIIDEASNISDDDIEDIKSMTIDKASGKSIFDSRTNDEIKEHITRQAKEAKEKLDSYSKISNDLKTLYGEDIQSDFLEELTWKMASIDDLEIRTQHVIDDIKKPLQYKAKEIKDTFGIDINVTLDTFSDFKNSFSEDSNIISEIVDVINNQDLYVEEGRERIEGIIRRYNKNIRDNNLSLGRNIRRIRLRSKSGEYSPDVIGSEEEARASAKENYNSLFSKIIELKDFLNHKNNKILSPLDVEKITNSLEDLIKLYSVRSEFIDSYMQLSKNPQLFTEGVQESIRKAMDNYENSQVDELLNKLKSANNIKDIENVSSSYDDNIVKKAISRAKSSNDSNLKNIMKAYDDYNKLSKSLSNILNNIPDSPEKISIVNVISDAVDNSSSAEEVITTLQKSVSELPKTVGDSIEKILKKVTKHKSSRESTEEDKNTPKRSMKKKKDTKKGFLSNFGDTIKPDAEILERTQESESRNTDEIKKEKDEDDTIEDAEVIEEDENVDVEIPTSDNAVEELERMSDRQLKKISNGEATIEDDDNKGSIKKLAKSILTSREALEEVNNAEGSNSEDNTFLPSTSDSPHLRSWVYSKYDFNALKDRSIRRAKINNNPIVEALDELDAFDFVDDGRLGVLFNENNNIPIHYVKVQDSRLEDVIVLAIEVTKNTSKLVDTSKSFVAQDGKRYQAVGALGYDSNNKESKRSYNTINWALEEEYNNYTKDESRQFKTSSTKGNSTSVIQYGNNDDINIPKIEIPKIEISETRSDSYLTKEEEERVIKFAEDLSVYSSDDIIVSTNDGSVIKISQYNDENGRTVGIYSKTKVPLGVFRNYNITNNPFHKGILNVEVIDDNTITCIWDLDVTNISAPYTPTKITITGNLAKSYIKAKKARDKDVEDYAKTGFKDINSATRMSSATLAVVTENISETIKETVNSYVGKKIENINQVEPNTITTRETPRYFVSSGQSNRIKHIYSGRMVKTTDEEAPRQRPLKDIVGDTPNLAVYYRGKMTAPTLDSEYDDIAPLNSNNANYRDGSVWFMSKEADGKYYSKAVKVKRFTESEYDIESHKDTPVVESIIEDIQTLVKPVSEFKSRKAAEYQKSIAKYNLMSSLYFPEDTVPVFFINKKGETIISITNYEDNIGDGLEGDDKVNEILNYLQSDDLNLRFQIIPNKLGESTYLKDLMNSDILTTDIALANNVNSSFDLYTVDNSGEIIEEVNSSRRKGHTGRKGVNGALVSKSLTLNSKSYSVTDSEVRLNGELITDENTIDEIRLLEKISSKSINPIEGNPKLFLGTYNNGEKFGIINGKVKTGKTLEGLLEAANKRKNNSIKENKSAAEKLKNLLKTKDNMETKQEKSENTSIFEDASDFNFDEVDNKIEDTSDSEEGTSLFSDDTDFVFPDMEDTIKEEKEEIKATPKKKKSKVTPSPVIMTDTFVPIAGRSAKELEEKIEDFESIANDYLDDIESLGYDNIDDFISYAESEGVDTSSVTTKEAFEAALETLKHCR